jgi:P4 family phage/plasmid primase-like protien
MTQNSQKEGGISGSSNASLRQKYQDNRERLFRLAQEYHEAGLWMLSIHSALCPNAIKRGKAPTHSAWQKDRLEWRDLSAELERVWTNEGGVNLGLKTGKFCGLVCIDVDAKSDGLQWFAENESILANPVVERTGGDGLHLYYRYPVRLAEGSLLTCSSTRRLFRGVDILADGAGQVVTAPSIHGRTGMEYKLDRGLNLIDALHEADELPEWIVEKMLVDAESRRARRDAEGGEAEGSKKVSVSATSADLFAARLFLQEANVAVEGDGGDFATLRVAMRLKDFGLSQKQVFDLMATEYNPRCSPPWDRKDLLQKIQNAFRYGKHQQGSSSVSNAFPEVQQSEVAAVVERSRQNSALEERAYSKKSAVHNARAFCLRHEGRIKCFSGNVVIYDRGQNRWRLCSDQELEGMVYRDIAESCSFGSLVKDMKVQMFSDVRRTVKFELNENRDIPDAHWLSGKRGGADYITLLNGILDVRTLELVPHSADWFSFSAVEAGYDSSARCDRFISFLEEIWECDEQLIDSLQKWVGYCILSQCNQQKFAVFKGASRAGKSTLMSVLEAVVGEENVATTSLSMLGSEFGLQPIVGKRLVTFQDADKASLDRMGVATERIKSLASNDSMGINRKNQSVIMGRMNCKLNFVCNSVPAFLNAENSMTKRMLVFPFWKSFENNEDLDLAQKLISEKSGILNWALVGARRIVLDGERLEMSGRGLETLREVERQLDSVTAFSDECIVATGHDHNFVPAESLWGAYRQWCRNAGRNPKHRQRFLTEVAQSRALKDSRVRTGGERGYRGVVLTNLFDFAEEPNVADSQPLRHSKLFEY